MNGSPATTPPPPHAETGLRFCPTCPPAGQWRTLQDFYPLRRKGRPDTYQYRCKDCASQRARDYHRTRAKARKRKYMRQGDRRTAEQIAANAQHTKAVRLARRLARANLVRTLCAQEWVREGHHEDLTCLLLRSLTYLSPEATGHLLGCSADDVRAGIDRARALLDWRTGDIRVRDAVARIRQQYRLGRAQADAQAIVLPYKEYPEVLRTGRRTPPTPAHPPPLDPILQAKQVVAHLQKVPLDALDGLTRGSRTVALARQCVMYLLSEQGMSHRQIAQALGRDHTTITHGIAQAQQRLSSTARKKLLAAVGHQS